MPSPSAVLPIEARQGSWRRLWERLLQPIPDDESETDDCPAEADDEAA